LEKWDRFVLLVKFAYLRTGRTGKLDHAPISERSVPEEIAFLCKLMQEQHALRETKKNTSLDNKAAQDNMQGLLREELQSNCKSALSLAEQGPKRRKLGVTSEDDDESYTPPSTRRTDTLILLQPYC
jgi:hypothetical protein